MSTRAMTIHVDKVQDLAGFAAENVKGGETVKVLTRALLTSDDPEFYQYSEQISNIFLNKNRIQIDGVHQFLVVIHQDLSADLYVNDFGVLVEIKAKRDIKAGEIVLRILYSGSRLVELSLRLCTSLVQKVRYLPNILLRSFWE